MRSNDALVASAWWPSPKGLTTVLGVGSTPPLMSLLLGSLRPSSRALPAPGPFLRFSLARMDDSRSGKGGISSSTVACGAGSRVRQRGRPGAKEGAKEGARGAGALTRTSVLATELRVRYSTARCCSSTSALRSWEPARSTPWMVALVSGKRLMNLM